MFNEGIRTFTAYEDLEARRRVKIKSSTTKTPPEVEYADAGEDYIGITEYAVSAGDLVACRLNSYPGTFEIECVVDSAIAKGTTLYGAADGKVSDASSGTAQGVSLSAATADNEHIEMAPWNVKATTAATVSVADADGHTLKTTVEAAVTELYEQVHTTQKTIPVPLNAISQEDGTTLTKLNSTTSGFSQLANKEIVLAIPIDATVEAFQFTTPVPQDLDDSADVEVHVLAGKAADLDELTLDCEVFPCADGDTANADIQDTAAQAITQAASELVFTCGADGVLAAPGTLSVVLTLGGTNDGDAVYIYGAWVEYKGKTVSDA